MYLLIAFLNFIGLEFTLQYPHLIYFVSVAITALTLFFIYRYSRKITVSKISIMISAVLFLIAHYALLLFLEGSLLLHGFIFLSSFILFVFLYSIFERSTFAALNRDSEKGREKSLALENIIGYFNLLIFFFLSIDIFYLELNTNQKFMWMFALIAFGAFFLSYSSLAIFAISLTFRTVLYIAVFLLALIELFWVINFLPISIYSKAALTTFVYYAILGLTKHYLIFGKTELTRRVVRRYLVITSCGVLLVFLTSRW